MNSDLKHEQNAMHKAMGAHWEEHDKRTNLRAILVVEETNEWVGGVEKCSRSSKYLRPWVMVHLGEWSGQLTLFHEWQAQITDVAEGVRLVNKFWSDHPAEFLLRSEKGKS